MLRRRRGEGGKKKEGEGEGKDPKFFDKLTSVLPQNVRVSSWQPNNTL